MRTAVVVTVTLVSALALGARGVQAQEEAGHAMKMLSFVEDRAGRVSLRAVEQPPGDFQGQAARPQGLVPLVEVEPLFQVAVLVLHDVALRVPVGVVRAVVHVDDIDRADAAVVGAEREHAVLDPEVVDAAGRHPVLGDLHGIHDVTHVEHVQVWLADQERFAQYLRPDEMHTAFNFDFMARPWDAKELRESIRTTLEAAKRYNFPLKRIIFEVTEQEQVLERLERAGVQDEPVDPLFAPDDAPGSEPAPPAPEAAPPTKNGSASTPLQ